MVIPCVERLAPGTFELIPLYGKRHRGRVAIVDVGFRAVSTVPSWHIDASGYIRGGSCGKWKLHRYVMHITGEVCPSESHVIDHINGDRLDNRRCNLRWVTPRQNQFNKHYVHGLCRFKGVHPWQGRWRAMIKTPEKVKHIGMFDTPEEAARAYDQRAIELFGEYACTNVDLGLLPPLPAQGAER